MLHCADDRSAWHLLRQAPVRRLIAQLCYADEWRSSLHQSHPPSLARQQLLDDFSRRLEVIGAALQPLAPFLQRLQDGDEGMLAEVRRMPVEWLPN